MTRIHVNQFAILCDSIDDKSNIELECSLGFHASEQCVSVSVKVIYTSADAEPLMVNETICQFAISEDSWYRTRGAALQNRRYNT